MEDESSDISARTRLRAADSINKAGYMNGASDGQDAAFQSSFDSGYTLGLQFGVTLGFNRAMSSFQCNQKLLLEDSTNMNCQICKNHTSLKENEVNLYNIQKEKNDELLCSLKYNV